MEATTKTAASTKSMDATIVDTQTTQVYINNIHVQVMAKVKTLTDLTSWLIDQHL